MILIADSGSTKTEWVLLDGKQPVASVNTQGINPYFLSAAQIAVIIKEELLPQLAQFEIAQITEIYYYGAGCSTTEKCDTISVALNQFITKAHIIVDHDLLGAARAACGTTKGIAVILGTGSNSCLFDGKNIIANQPSLGFILGDEGSGGYIGKELLKQFLYNELPADVHKKFDADYAITKDLVLNKIYKEPAPNKYAASFSHFVSANIEHPQMQQLVLTAFDEFFRRHISSYTQFNQFPISVVGSVGYIFEKQLNQIAGKYNCTIKKIIQKPMDGLIHYHTN